MQVYHQYAVGSISAL